MKEQKDALKVIQTYADREPAHTGGAERAKQLTAQLYGEGAALLLAYFWPGQREGPFYYGDDAIYREDVEDVGRLREENGLNFLYYDANNLPSRYEVGRLVEDGRIMYIIQDTMLISQLGFDTVSLGICFSDDTFQDFGDFIELESVLTVENYNIQYRVESSAQNNFYAKFTVEGVVYYLNVTTAGGTEVLQGYIEQLLH